MPWLRIDDGFVEHPKIIDLSPYAFKLHVAGLCYCARNLTDGILGPRQVMAVCAISGATRRHLIELVSAEVWQENGDEGYEINDYLNYNPSAAKVKQDREEARERMRSLRSSRERSREQTANNARTSREVRQPHPIPRKPSDGVTSTEDVANTINRSLEEAKAS